MKKEYDKALYRLLSIIDKLVNDEKPTMRELQDEFNVSERTIQRDINERLTGFNIVKNSQKQLYFGYEVDLKKSFLRVEEMYFLSLSLSQLEDIDETYNSISRAIFRKFLKKEIYNPYFIKPERFQPIDEDKEMMKTLENAIIKHQSIEIMFNHKPLTLYPYKIASFEGIWYLFADDAKDDRLKTYMIARIENLKLLKEKFTPMPEIDTLLDEAESAWYVEGNSFEVQVNVDKKIAEYFTLKKHLESQKILETYEDGSLRVSFNISHDEDVDNLIKSWLPHIKVISPIRFKNRITKELTHYLEELQSE